MAAEQANIWLEIVRIVPSIVTAAVAVVGVVIAVKGLDKWRLEAIGKRRAELAEEVLADFYEARDIIMEARAPLSLGEGTTRVKGADEDEDDTQALNAYYAVAERLSNKGEFFAKLNARRYRFMAHFGRDAAKPYAEMRTIHNDIMIAVRMLIRTYKNTWNEEKAKQHEKWESLIWWEDPENDAVARRLDAAVDAMEVHCRPVIQADVEGRSRRWRVLSWKQ